MKSPISFAHFHIRIHRHSAVQIKVALKEEGEVCVHVLGGPLHGCWFCRDNRGSEVLCCYF